MVDAEVRVADPHVTQKALLAGISVAHPGHFGISHQYAQKDVGQVDNLPPIANRRKTAG